MCSRIPVRRSGAGGIMKKIYIVHYSISGSTAEIAGILDRELSAAGFSVEVASAADARELDRFDAVIIGSPMRMGGVRPAIGNFINAHAGLLSRKKVFFYYSLLYVIRIAGMPDFSIPCHIDPSLGFRSIARKDASGFDTHHSLDYYMKKLGRTIDGIGLAGIAFFNGRLVINTLSLPERLFMRMVVRLTPKEKEGNFLNPDAVREWARKIQSMIQQGG